MKSDSLTSVEQRQNLSRERKRAVKAHIRARRQTRTTQTHERTPRQARVVTPRMKPARDTVKRDINGTHVSAVWGCSACDVTSSALCHHPLSVDMSRYSVGTAWSTMMITGEKWMAKTKSRTQHTCDSVRRGTKRGEGGKKVRDDDKRRREQREKHDGRSARDRTRQKERTHFPATARGGPRISVLSVRCDFNSRNRDAR